MNNKNCFSKPAIWRSDYFQANVGGVPEKISWYARQKMFESLVRLARPTPETTVLDVGVTSDQRSDSNFFERLYPYLSRVTAVGLEDASFVKRIYPALKYVRADGLTLPFHDKSFDLVVSFAVIEHIGDFDRQETFIHELFRVGKAIFITTPNRWYPIEFHTLLPLVHWFPPYWFRAILKVLGKDFFAKEENLNLLGEKEFVKMVANVCYMTTNHTRLLRVVSNLVFYCIPK